MTYKLNVISRHEGDACSKHGYLHVPTCGICRSQSDHCEDVGLVFRLFLEDSHVRCRILTRAHDGDMCKQYRNKRGYQFMKIRKNRIWYQGSYHSFFHSLTKKMLQKNKFPNAIHLWERSSW